MLEPVEERLYVRSTLLWALASSVVLFIFGILTRKPSGFVFGLVALYLAAVCIKRAFDWSPDPHARRNFLLFALATVVIGGLGTVAIDTATVELLMAMGRCPASASIPCL
jgi:hypothetical protein